MERKLHFVRGGSEGVDEVSEIAAAAASAAAAPLGLFGQLKANEDRKHARYSEEHEAAEQVVQEEEEFMRDQEVIRRRKEIELERRDAEQVKSFERMRKNRKRAHPESGNSQQTEEKGEDVSQEEIDIPFDQKIKGIEHNKQNMSKRKKKRKRKRGLVPY